MATSIRRASISCLILLGHIPDMGLLVDQHQIALAGRTMDTGTPILALLRRLQTVAIAATEGGELVGIPQIFSDFSFE